jgi:hypothetical protein
VVNVLEKVLLGVLGEVLGWLLRSRYGCCR